MYLAKDAKGFTQSLCGHCAFLYALCVRIIFYLCMDLFYSTHLRHKHNCAHMLVRHNPNPS